MTQILGLPRVSQGSFSKTSSETDLEAATTSEDASNLAVAILIFKVFFGSGFLIVPKGFQNAGIVFGPLCLFGIYFLEIASILNLIQCRRTLGPGFRYEDMAAVMGRMGVKFVFFVIALCQFGFASIWFVTCAENFGMIVPHWSAAWRLWISLPLTMPMVWVHQLKLLAVPNFIAIVMCTVAALYLSFFAGSQLQNDGARPVPLINSSNADSLLWLGACAYLFEGINTVLPIYESARDKMMVPKLIVVITLFINIVYTLFGCLFYAALGDSTKDLATLNLSQGSFWGTLLPGSFALVGIFTTPVIFYVVWGMYEPYCPWSARGWLSKLQKNAVRSLVVLAVFAVTWLGGQQLQNLLALVGGLCCATLALIVPSVLHVLICKPGRLLLAQDVCIFIAGLFILVLSSAQAIASWK